MSDHSTPPSDRPVLLGELSWIDVVELTEKTQLVVIPVGAVEQHGPHLPLLVDAIAVEALAREVSRRTGIAVAPTMTYSSSQGHSRVFPGTVSLSPEIAQATLEELVDWLANAGFRKIFILNGHLGNIGIVWNAVDNSIARLSPDTSVVAHSWWDLTSELWQIVTADTPTAVQEFHANWAETSLTLFLRPELVRMDRAVDQDEGVWAFTYDMSRKSRSGAVGRRITQSSAADGQRIFDVAVEALTDAVDRMLLEQPPPAPTVDMARWRKEVARELRGDSASRSEMEGDPDDG